MSDEEGKSPIRIVKKCMKSMAQRSFGRPGIAGTCRLTALFRLRGFFLRRLSPSSRYNRSTSL